MENQFKILVLLCAGLITGGCTENYQSKNLGGNMTIEIPRGQKFVNATWKDNELWYLTRSARPGEINETYTFKEKSSFGLVEGTVIFNENN